MVYDPVDAKIAQDWNSSGNNTTGASPRVSMAKLVNTLKQLKPVKKLAVLYTPGEKNSETQLKEIQAVQGETQVKVVPVPLSAKAEVATTMPEVMNSADAVYLSGSSVVGETIGTIVDEAVKAKMVTVSHLEDHVEKGVLLGVTASPKAVGMIAGEKAAKVLKGAKPSSLPIEQLKKFDVILNQKTAKASQVQIPAGFLKATTRVIE
jgi:putative ABC transport system substrate-binding protein